MNRIKVNLMGGLCNYFFQIAAAYAYSKKYNKELVLTTHDSVVIHKHLDTYKDNILSNVKFSNENRFNNYLIYNENGFHYTEIPFIDKDLILNGYFQSEKYFLDFRSEVKNLFCPQFLVDEIKLKNQSVLEKNTCSIHVRRGDYLNSPNHHPEQDMGYYIKAIKQISKDSLFLIFSDDMAWCKDNFSQIPGEFIFVEGNKDYEDLILMSLCNNNIITNSTFSWWAAWLNGNENKKVIIPKRWFGIAYANWNTSDLYCENWIKI